MVEVARKLVEVEVVGHWVYVHQIVAQISSNLLRKDRFELVLGLVQKHGVQEVWARGQHLTVEISVVLKHQGGSRDLLEESPCLQSEERLAVRLVSCPESMEMFLFSQIRLLEVFDSVRPSEKATENSV